MRHVQHNIFFVLIKQGYSGVFFVREEEGGQKEEGYCCCVMTQLRQVGGYI